MSSSPSGSCIQDRIAKRKGINLPMEVCPTEDTVHQLLRYLVDAEEVQGTPSESQQEYVAKKVHAVAVLYNYYHLNPEKEFLEFKQFCNLVIKFKPYLRQYMPHMNQPNCPNLNNPENQLSIVEKAIMDACRLSETLRVASSNISNMIKEWPVTKVAVFLIDSKKQNCFIRFDGKLWSIIEKVLDFDGSVYHDDNGEVGLKEVAISAAKKVAGINSKLEVLEDHVVYSLSQAKTATHFYIVQITQSTRKYRITPIKHVIFRLQGPLVKKYKDSWITTRVIEYYYLLPYAEIISKWFRSNDSIQMGVEKKSGIVSLHEDSKRMLVYARRSKSSEATLQALLIKKQKLTDELSLCDKKIQEISQGGSVGNVNVKGADFECSGASGSLQLV